MKNETHFKCEEKQNCREKKTYRENHFGFLIANTDFDEE